MRGSVSVEWDRIRDGPDALDMLDGCEWLSVGSLELLLRVRHMDATLDSGSFLLYSRVIALKPNFFRNEDVFEFTEPELPDRVRFKEFVPDLEMLSSKVDKTSPKRLSESSNNRSRSMM